MNTMPVALHSLLETSQIRRFPSGQILFFEGDSTREIYIIKSGIVKIYDIDSRGSEKILHLLQAPSVAPFTFFNSQERPIEWFYAALTDCEVYVVSALLLQHAMYADSSLAFCLMREFSKNTQELMLRLSSLGKSKAFDKVVYTLQFLTFHFGRSQRDNWCEIPFSVNQQFISDMAGVTRESVTTAFKDLVAQKAIKQSGQSLLIHKTKLHMLYRQAGVKE